MDRAQVEKFLQPQAADSPCGPDLDLAGDAEFMNALARADSLLPGQFFEKSGNDEERPFARGSRNFEPEVVVLLELLNRSRDIRLIVLLAKFYILDRKLSEFINAIDLISKLVETQWQDLNPKEEDGDFAFRMAALQSLDDYKHILLPLQYTQIIRHPRAGVIIWRNKLLADGAEPRGGETGPDAAALNEAFLDVDISQLIGQRDLFALLAAAADKINAISSERVGYEAGADLTLLRGLAREILNFLDDYVGRRDPGAALRPPATTGATDIDDTLPDDQAVHRPIAVGGLGSVAAVAASLAAVAEYFQRSEPSNPALLLVRQAEQLVGRTFSEVMQILLPEHVESAAIEIGRRQTFVVPVHRLATSAYAAEAPMEALCEPPVVSDRGAALLELQKIEAYYGARETTSPIPFFCERARKLTGQDFLSILKEILPENTLKSIES